MNDKILDSPTPERSRTMSRIKSRDTKPELALRRALREAGLVGYRKNFGKLPGTPDVAFTKYRLAVFVDGDFWHGRDLEKRRERLTAGHNGAFWVAKIGRNAARDLWVNKELRAMGWAVLRIWTSDVSKDPAGCVSRVRDALREPSI